MNTATVVGRRIFVVQLAGVPKSGLRISLKVKILFTNVQNNKGAFPNKEKHFFILFY